MRRRRRYRSGGGISPRILGLIAGAAGLLVIGAFFWGLTTANNADPPSDEIRTPIDLTAPAQEAG